ncbi:histidine protein methyltransferase 1 homolog [Ceratitis capitata]|uniref:protein-histidine N-methyltransferase n=1 Tax=Ceratitis capitata TaxID=7213 RepID=A0A811UMM7_CERCA|nr:histidine protein methyltransferase 1 homolog [Ceratitis capitata]CAD7000070.1 unnamed protein product [Ceratitis capitata]
MFKFSFNIEVDSDNPFNDKNKEEEKRPVGNASNDNEQTDEPAEWYKAERVEISADILDNLDVYKLNATTLNVGNTTIQHVVTGFLLEHITCNSAENKDITKAEQTHSDLLPAVYEGGAKIWECTDDLLQYLAKNFDSQSWYDKRILDLGCGAGLLGIYVYRYGAVVHFQDYNKDVLTQITIPNVLLNVENSTKTTSCTESASTEAEEVETLNIGALKDKVQFYAGDWCEYTKLAAKDAYKFDYILTSETIYNPKNQQKLLDTFYSKLSTNGVVLVAAKTYYFGVGGGMRQFEQLINIDKRFQYKVLWTSTDGVGREILELKLKK